MASALVEVPEAGAALAMSAIQMRILRREQVTPRTAVGIDHTPHVLAVGDRLQVIGVHAGSNTTQMVEFETIRDGSDEPFVDQPWRSGIPVSSSAARDVAVSGAVFGSVPYPAAVAHSELVQCALP